jgi:poly(A) polymerase
MIKQFHNFFKSILTETKFNGKTFFVGGCVRDYFRNQPAHDVDIVIDMKNGSKELAEYIFNFVNTNINKNIITVPFQLGHYPIYSITFKEDFTLYNVDYKFKDMTIEIADTMNEAFPDENSRQREVQYGTLEEDIYRRDFSINSGLIDVVSFEFKDLTENKTIMQDLKNKIIRCNKDSIEYIDSIFMNDPLRILRGIVFAVRFNFEIDSIVKERMIKNVNRLNIISRERINAEIKKALNVQQGAYKLVKLLNEIHALEIVFPGIERLKSVYQCNKNEDGTFSPDVRKIHMEGKTVFEHTMAVLRFAKPGFINGLAAIYHDVGKIYPENKNGKIRFIHHEKIGAKIVSQIFPEMKIDNDTTKNVVFLVRNHMKLHQLKDLSKKNLRRFIRDIPSNELRFMLYDLCNADCLGTVQEIDGILTSISPHFEAMELVENLIKDDSISIEKPFRYFNGNEIMEILKISTGKAVGEAIKIMLKIQDEYGFEEDKEFIASELIKRFKQNFK